MPVLATFLRKNHRALKLATLNALDVLITNYGKPCTVLKYQVELLSENLSLVVNICNVQAVILHGYIRFVFSFRLPQGRTLIQRI